MENYYFITNNCQAVSLYHLINREYDTPFIGSYIQDDLQYLKLCKNYDYYMNLKPTFGNPILPVENKGHPTMFLDDIEISWIHETNEQECLEKYNRRKERSKGKKPFFIWGDSLLHQYHQEEKINELAKEFSNIPDSLYLSQDFSEEWKGCLQTDRKGYEGGGWATPTNWIKPELVNSLVVEYFNLI